MTGPTRAPATLAADLAGVSWATRENGNVTRRESRHDAETWAQMGSDRGREAVMVIPVASAGHLVTLDVALDWVAEQLADPEVLREANRYEIQRFIAGARGPRDLRKHFCDGLLAALRDRVATPAPTPDTDNPGGTSEQ